MKLPKTKPLNQIYLTILLKMEISKALEKVTNSSEYKSELQGYAPNSVKVLDLVKRSLDDKIGTTTRMGQNDRAKSDW